MSRTAYALTYGAYSDYSVLAIFESEQDARQALADPVLFGFLWCDNWDWEFEGWEDEAFQEEFREQIERWHEKGWGAMVEAFDYYPALGPPFGLPIVEAENR